MRDYAWKVRCEESGEMVGDCGCFYCSGHLDESENPYELFSDALISDMIEEYSDDGLIEEEDEDWDDEL